MLKNKNQENISEKLVLVINDELVCLDQKETGDVAIFDTKKFFKRSFDHPIWLPYGITLEANNIIIFEKPLVTGDFFKAQWTISKEFKTLGEKWNLAIWLNENGVNERSSWIPIIFLLFGLIISTMLTVMIRLWQLSILKNKLLEQYGVLFNSMDEGFCIIEMIFDQNQKPIDWIYLKINPSFEKQTGLKNVQDKKVSEVISNLEAYWLTAFGKVALGGEAVRFENYAKELERWYEVYAFRFKGAEKNQVALLFNDISTRKNTEILLVEKQMELERSNLELDDFAYIASHDLKEPLRGINNFSGFLLEDYADKLDNDGKEKLHILQDLSIRMEKLIDTLLTYSRVGRVDLAISPCNINQIIQEKLDFLAEYIKEKHVEITVCQNMPIIRCDQARIGEIFQNLITNAIKYNDHDIKTIDIDVKENNHEYIFSVKDNGIGIAKKHQEQVFKIFKRLHGKNEYGGGTGAGMTIVKRIVERHNGKIWMESELGFGTTMYFSISKNIKKSGENSAKQ